MSQTRRREKSGLALSNETHRLIAEVILGLSSFNERRDAKMLAKKVKRVIKTTKRT